MAQKKIQVRPRKPPRFVTCSTCGGEGGRMPSYRDMLAYDGDPQDLVVWCPQCGGEGMVRETPEEWEMEWDDPYEVILGRSEERTGELAQWVQIYREARHQMRLPPHEAARLADDVIYGPLPTD